eukprot:scaffold1730_cov69-Skeletonema_dohrnii-CCMP3373.AAC.6
MNEEFSMCCGLLAVPWADEGGDDFTGRPQATRECVLKEGGFSVGLLCQWYFLCQESNISDHKDSAIMSAVLPTGVLRVRVVNQLQPTPILFSIQLHLVPSLICTHLRGTSEHRLQEQLIVEQPVPLGFQASASTANSCEVGVIIFLPPHSVLSTASTQWRQHRNGLLNTSD